MSSKKWAAIVCTGALAAGALAGCGGKDSAPAADGKGDNAPFPVSMALLQVGDIPNKGSEFEQAVEKYTHTKLDIQWIPQAAFDEKVNVMIASNEMPKIMKVNYVPATISAIQGGQFWEIGPLLKDYKNLSAQDAQYYENISVDGKIYGIPNFRDIGRAAIVYRKDWFDALGLKVPASLEDWYNVMKAIATKDPDKNGKDDTYGTVLFKKYNEGTQPVLTRIAVGLGGVNRWGVDNGKFTPEFLTPEYVDVMKLFRKLFAEKLINADFAAFDQSEADKMMDAGRVAMKLNGVANNGKSFQDRLVKIDPKGVLDVEPFAGPKGPRLAGEPGNFGFLAFPKSAVKTEAELKKVLSFLDQLMDTPMSMLQLRGIENKHYKHIGGGKTEMTDLTAFQREIKPYRDNMVNVEGYNVAPLKDTPLGDKGTEMTRDNGKYAVPNPALTLTSAMNTERGKDLDQMIWDAQTKYIMGQIDDAGWQAEVDKWRKAGGDKLIEEYEEAYALQSRK
ncbi:extracellular solute-binding protein [Paenibacillus sp. TAB 01]|uniref:extracellular solute-binding protein n=1 Tax=Paenibacillus sp. TAB 01 TaxID=3368988 RepID=UPI00375114A0